MNKKALSTVKKINVCFDGRVLEGGLNNGKSRTGIYFVARNLFLELSKRSDKINLFLYMNQGFARFDELNANLGIKIDPKYFLHNNSDFTEIDAFFSPVFKVPEKIRQYPQISSYTTLYDIIALLYPQYFSPDFCSGWYGELINSLNPEDYYFTISDYTKKDFLQYFPMLDKAKMTTIPLSTNFAYSPNKNAKVLQKVKNKYHIPTDKKYLFSLCSLEPRKNLVLAVKSFIKFIEKNKINDLVYVLGGGAWEGFIEKLEHDVPEYQKHADKIIRAGYVDDEDLEPLYSNAEWFVYTSQYEGFGMPPLEAMACGCPVVTSNNTSLPEVVGDAGVMIDWDSEEQHIKAYEKYYSDEKYRDKMAQKGLKRAKQFSWTKAVDIIVDKMISTEKKKQNTPLVTVITPSYNLIQGGRKETFAQNIDSVQKQTYKNIEHLVIDGASTDGTLELLKEYKKKGQIVYYSEPDKGIYDAMNKGILKAKGKYVICLNSDDFYCNDRAIEFLVKKAEENDADACYGDAVRVRPQTLEIMNDWKGKGNVQPWKPQFPCHQTFLIKTDVMKELGLYKVKYKVCADNDFFICLTHHNKKIVGIDAKIIYFRDGGFSNDHFDIVVQDKTNCLFEELGQYHHLTKYDCGRLILNRFLGLPLQDAIDLGSKLEKREWVKQYFTQLITHHINQVKAQIPAVQPQPQNTKVADYVKVFKLFNVIPVCKICRTADSLKVRLFKFLPVYEYRQQPWGCKGKIFGLPLFRTSEPKHKKDKKTKPAGKYSRIKDMFFALACKQNVVNRKLFLLVDNTFNDEAELTDNFALFEYLQTQPEYKAISYYIINKNNVNFNQIKQKYPRNIIPVAHGVLNWKLLRKLFFAKYWMDAFQVISAFDPDAKMRKGKITTVYTQHGINYFKPGFWGDASISPKYFNKIIFSNQTEKQLFKKYYGYHDDNGIIAGLPRWDLIKNESKEKIIFIYFTSRAYLRMCSRDEFVKTRYYQNIYQLLSSPQLQELLKKHNIKLYAGIHHEMKKDENIRKALSHIEFIEDKDIGKIKQKASLLVTDFSSMCFDFMIKDKPVIFFHIDNGDELLKRSMGDSYVNDLNVESKNDELYNVFYKTSDVINNIKYYANHQFELEKSKKAKNSNFFAYRTNIRQHIIENLVKSSTKTENYLSPTDSSSLDTLEYNKVFDFNDVSSVSTGFGGRENTGRWSVSKNVSILFKLPQKHQTKLTFDCYAYINDKHKRQKVDVYVNNTKRTKWLFNKNNNSTTRSVILFPQDMNEQNTVELKFVVKKPISPLTLGEGNDSRPLGVHFQSIKIDKE